MIFLFSMLFLLLSAGIIALCVKESLKEKPQKAETREGKEGVEINIAVSYTHIDVYKRQELHGAGSALYQDY